MGYRPGVYISQRATPPPRSAPTDTGVWHIVCLADAGPLGPTLVQSMADFERIFGLRQSYAAMSYDSLDVFFREGGGSAMMNRVVGPAAASATKNLLDGSAAISLVATAIGPGAYYNAIKVGVRAGSAGGTVVIFIQDANSVEVEASPDLATQQAAQLWGQYSNYIRLSIGVSTNLPAVAAAAVLAGGADDRNNIVDANWASALALDTPDKGPGQVSAPGQTTSARHLQLLAHAAANRRIAVLDAPDTSTAATLVAGLIARNAGLGPASPSAGDLGISLFATALSQPAWDDPTRQTLNNGGVDVIRLMFGQVRVYGWRTLVDSTADPTWANLGGSRTFMAIASDASVIAEAYVFDKIDGQGKLMSSFSGALSGMLLDYFNNGYLYGGDPNEAFFVNVGNQVNTPTTLANNELHAVLNIRISPFGEFVQVEIVKRAITEAVA